MKNNLFMTSNPKIIPLPPCPIPSLVLLEQQIREEINKMCVIPEYLLDFKREKHHRIWDGREIPISCR